MPNKFSWEKDDIQIAVLPCWSCGNKKQGELRCKEFNMIPREVSITHKCKRYIKRA